MNLLLVILDSGLHSVLCLDSPRRIKTVPDRSDFSLVFIESIVRYTFATVVCLVSQPQSFIVQTGQSIRRQSI